MSKQEEIIGLHGNLTSALKDWLICADISEKEGQCIRHLDENSQSRNALLDECAWWLVMRHVGKETWDFIQEERQTLSAADFKDLIDTGDYLPTDDKTRKGNLGEILLSKYLEEVTGYTSFGIYRFEHSPNVNKSMHGDDVLLFHPTDVYQGILYGESKIRGIPSNGVIDDIVNTLQGGQKLPLSISFMTRQLRTRGNAKLARDIDLMHVQLAKGTVPMRNVGMLMSKRDSQVWWKDTLSKVKQHLYSNNPNLAFMALGIDNVQQFVDDAYQKANNILYTGQP